MYNVFAIHRSVRGNLWRKILWRFASVNENLASSSFPCAPRQGGSVKEFDETAHSDDKKSAQLSSTFGMQYARLEITNPKRLLAWTYLNMLILR